MTRSNERAEHIPVLLEEVMEHLAVSRANTVVDVTVGLGGHAARILGQLGSEGRLIGVDRDPESLELARERLRPAGAGAPRVDLVHANFQDLDFVLKGLGIQKVDRVLADLGVSSPQLDRPERGFSFRQAGPLDMRMDPTRGEPAARLIERLSADRLAEMFSEYGEERFSQRIARQIVARREKKPIETTVDLAEIVRAAIPARSAAKERIDPATRVFQALRIAVNEELVALDALLGQLPRLVRSGGRAVIVSFHSLEDRQVKRAFRAPGIWRELTKKPVQASESEASVNARARSAKLRAALRLDTTDLSGEGSRSNG